MRYALHIAIPCILLWNVKDGDNAAKTAVNPEVLAALAKNVAAVLSPSLLNDHHVPRPSRTSATPPSRQYELQPKSSLKSDVKQPLQVPTIDNRNRNSRNPQQDGFPIRTPADRLQAIYITSAISQDQQQDAKQKGPESLSRVVSPQNVNTPRKNKENRNTNDHDKADVSAADIHHFHRFRLPEFHKHKPVPLYGGPIGHYGPFGLPPHYNHYPSFSHSYHNPTASTGQTSEVETEGVDNNPPATEELRPSARTAYRPYDRPYNDPYYPPFYGHPGSFYPGGRTDEATNQPNNPEDGQPDSNSSTAPEDRGRAGFRSYGYDPYYHDAFYGRPFHYSPYGPQYSPEGNSTGEEPRFRDYGFNTHYPYRPSFYGHPQENDPSRNPPDEGSTVEDGQADGNATTTNGQPPYGHHSFRPLYGGFHLQGYPSLSYNLLPYDHFNAVFNTPIKDVPFPGFYPDLQPYFPHPYPHPFIDGFHPYGFHKPVAAKNPSKPEPADETSAGSPEAPSEASASADAEVTSESKLEKLIRASRLTQNKNKLSASVRGEV